MIIIYNYEYYIDSNKELNSESNLSKNLKENESKNNGVKLAFDLKRKKY